MSGPNYVERIDEVKGVTYLFQKNVVRTGNYVVSSRNYVVSVPNYVERIDEVKKITYLFQEMS